MHPEKQRLFTHIYASVGLAPPAEDAYPEQIQSESPSDDPMASAWERNVSFFDSRHVVNVSYPSALLLKDKAEILILNKPFEADRRYAPFPLIQDDDVNRNTCRQDWRDNTFFSIYKASSRATLQDCKAKFTYNDLCKDVRIAAQCHGSTNLTAVIYRTTDASIPHIRIRRGTTYVSNNVADHDSRDYDMPLGWFLNSQDGSRWHQDLIHLIGISDDRAARHVYLRLANACKPGVARPGSIETFEKFIKSFGKGDRLPNYESFLDQVVSKGKRNSIFSKAKICVLCSKPLGGTKHQATILPCDDTHVVGRSCLLGLMRPGIHNTTADPERIACPYSGCNKKLFTDPELLQALKCSVTNGQFQTSSQFDTWETFERSCADLDKTSALKNTSTRITINSDFLLKIWYKTVHSGQELRILHHLKHINSPEFKTFEKLLKSHLARLEGVNTSLANLMRFLKKQIFLEFNHQWLSAGRVGTLIGSDRNAYENIVIRRDHAVHQADHLEKILPPGFATFMHTTLNRTLQFVALRAANGRAGEEFFKIGGREYFDPRCMQIVERTQAMREVFFWQRGDRGRAYLKAFSQDDNNRDSRMLLQ